MTAGGDKSEAPERRATPLAKALAQRIARDGPMPVIDYMRACLDDPEHGYYRARQAIGRSGDFVTAPEISQVFGELVGLWSVVVWQQMGSPQAFDLIEIGPGRGTLMADALRAAALAPDFAKAARVRLVEVNPGLRDAQRASLSGIRGPADLEWVDRLDDILPDLPAIIIGNEFLDVLPVDQTAAIDHQQMTRCVTAASAGLAFALRSQDTGSLYPDHPDDIVEQRPDVAKVMGSIAKRSTVAALFVDYGHAEAHVGDTLQAVRNHAFEHPLASPGEADLTAQVAFGAVARDAVAAGLDVDGPVTQGEWLGALGIAHRASRLMSANPSRALEIEAGIARLMSPTGMGSRFKVIGLRPPKLPRLPGL